MDLRAVMLGALLVFAAGCRTEVDDAASTKDDLIGGDSAHNAELPATVSISVAGKHVCTAAKVSPKQLITAAHCVLDLSTMDARYDATHPVTITLPSGASSVASVADTHVHPLWTSKCAETLCSVSAVTAKLDAPDVAVIDLVAELANVAIAPVERSALAAGDAVVVTGFGCTTGVYVADATPVTALKSAPLTIALPTAAEHDGSFVTAADEPVYSGNYALTAGRAGLCPGDSGGPLYKLVDGVMSVVGVNANYTLKPDAEDAVGIPVTNWHTRLDTDSRNHVGQWLSAVGIP